MPLDFPSSPSVNQVYSSGGNAWVFDGTAWNATSSISVFTGATGATGSVSGDYVSNVNGVTGTIGLSAGSNITITPSGNTFTISAAGGSPAGTTGYIQYHTLAGFSADDGLIYTSSNETLQIGSGSKPLLIYAVGAGGNIEVPGNSSSVLNLSSGTNSVGTVNIGNSAGIGIVVTNSSETVDLRGTVSFTDPTGVYTNTFPTGTGSSGQALITNGAGTLSWGYPINSTIQTIDFSKEVDGVYFTVTGLTNSNDVYRFENVAGKTAILRNGAGTINIVGTIYSASSYWNGGVTYNNAATGAGILPYARDVEVEMRSPFYQGSTVYYASDVVGLSVVYFCDQNSYTRLLPSGLTLDGFSVGSTFGGGTFSISGVTVSHNEGTDSILSVTGQSWVSQNSFINCKCLGLTSDDHEPEDAVLEEIRFEVDNIVPGVGFDIIGHAPNGTYGKYKVKCIGQ